MIGKEMMSDSKFFMGYSRWLDVEGRYERWDESVKRVMDMHRERYKDKMTPELEKLINFAEEKYKEKRVLGAQRALQFGGEQLLKHVARIYNCVSTHIDRAEAFQETMYLLLCGAGVGFSVQKQHVEKLPNITNRYNKKSKVFVVSDSIEGWADSFGVLLSSFFEDNSPFPEYKGCHVAFDFSKIRPKGSEISGGFKAPGPDGLRNALQKCEDLLINELKEGKTRIRPIVAYDFIMHMADAVLSGGVRRSATICMFSKDDKDMLNAKTGDWFIKNPQRGRSNNSVMLLRDELTREEWSEIMNSVREFGEPGFIFTDNLEFTFNPCVEIGKLPKTEDGRSGFQACVRGNTKLITRDGIEEIKDCAENDKEIEIWNGVEWKALTPFKTGNDREFYRVEYSDGSFIDVTENHQFAVKNRFDKDYRKVSTLEMLREIDESPYPIHIPRSNIVYDKGNDYVGSYDVGFVLGDATITKNGDVFASVYDGSGKEEVSFQTKVRRKGPYKKSLSSYQKADGTPLSDYHNVYFEGVDVNFCKQVKDITEGLPYDIFSWSRRSILEFIAGWADADGSQASKGIRIYGNENKIRDAQLLLSKCGINSSVNLMQKKGVWVDSLGLKRKNDIWYIQITKTNDIPCQRLTCDNNEDAKCKGKNQIVRSVRKLNVIEDSYCLYEESRNMCVFNNALTYQCNLCEISGASCNTKEDFIENCKAASIIGTLQAGYTDFKYLSEASREIVEREALIGVSVTGWMNNPDVLFDEQNMIDGAEEVKKWNKKVAKIIGINPAARTTCVKPSGNASVLLGTASGIHGEHSKLYFRNVQMNEQDDVLHSIVDKNPKMVEDSVWSSTGTDKVVSFPVVSDEGSVFKNSLLGVKQLEYVKKAQQYWVEYGTDESLCTDKRLRHNVSNTITVDDWDEVEEYIYNNKQWFAGISLLSSMGDKAYPQAPFTEVFTASQIMEMYGDASMFASGLIVDGLHAFDNNLWTACDTVNGWGVKLDPESSEHLLKRDWVRRAKNFANNYFNGDILTMTNCLKDCYNFHKWKTIERTIQPIDFTQEIGMKHFVDVDTLGATACAGGTCSIEF